MMQYDKNGNPIVDRFGVPVPEAGMLLPPVETTSDGPGFAVTALPPVTSSAPLNPPAPQEYVETPTPNQVAMPATSSYAVTPPAVPVFSQYGPDSYHLAGTGYTAPVNFNDPGYADALAKNVADLQSGNYSGGNNYGIDISNIRKAIGDIDTNKLKITSENPYAVAPTPAMDFSKLLADKGLSYPTGAEYNAAPSADTGYNPSGIGSMIGGSPSSSVNGLFLSPNEKAAIAAQSQIQSAIQDRSYQRQQDQNPIIPAAAVALAAMTAGGAFSGLGVPGISGAGGVTGGGSAGTLLGSAGADTLGGAVGAGATGAAANTVAEVVVTGLAHGLTAAQVAAAAGIPLAAVAAIANSAGASSGLATQPPAQGPSQGPVDATLDELNVVASKPPVDLPPYTPAKDPLTVLLPPVIPPVLPSTAPQVDPNVPDLKPTDTSKLGPPGLGQQALDWIKANPLEAAKLGLSVAGGIAGATGSSGSASGSGNKYSVQNPLFKAKLPTAQSFAQRTPTKVVTDWNRYGMGPEASFFNTTPDLYPRTPSNAVKPPAPYAKGGYAVTGPGTGRSDDIAAKLSDGEYVMDAETVALLGDGSSKAGADRLDKFRVNIRKHKGQALSKGKFSVNAKAPEAYLAGGRR